MDYIKILYVIATLDRAGAESQLSCLARALDTQRFASFVACLTRGGPIEDELRQDGIPYEILGKRGKYDLSVIRRLARLIEREKPDIVHTWLFTANAFGRTAAVLAGCPHLIASERCVDPWKKFRHRFIDRFLGRFTDRVVANAEAVRRFYIRSGIPEHKIVVIRNGLDLSRFAAIRRTAAAEDAAKIIGTVARLEDQKGVVYLLEAVGLLKSRGHDIHLVVVGDGPLKDKLIQRCAQLEITDRVRFAGRSDDAAALVATWDAFVLASLWEGLPNVVIEAQALGVPVVATDVGGVSELIENGKTGLLVAPRDPQDLADRVEWVMTDRVLAAEMAFAARAQALTRYRVDTMVQRYEALYEEVVAGGRPSKSRAVSPATVLLT